MTREEMQTEAREAAITALTADSRASLIMGTGTGKSKTVLDIIKHFNPSKITWLTNSEELRDRTAPDEYIKWDCEYLLDRTTFMCYQTAYTLVGQDLGFVVADEFDFSITEEYIKVYNANTIDKLLGVTASYRENQLEALTSIAPIVYTFSTQDAQDAGILNKTKYVFVEYMLSTAKDIRMEVGNKNWMTSEQEQYDYLERQYTSALISYLSAKALVDAWYNTIFPEGDIRIMLSDKTNKLKKLKWINNQRFSFLMKLNSSRTVARALLNRIHTQKPKDKVIVFASYTDQIDKLCTHTYHAKNKGTKKDPNPNITLLNEGTINELGVCQSINRGANLVGLNHAVLVDYDGSHVKGQQRIGRLCRLLASDEATIWILRPFYMKKVKVKKEDGTFVFETRRTATRAIAWSETMLADFRVDDNNSRTIKYA
jgi:superfamily II DNA or RNA helicase